MSFFRFFKDITSVNNISTPSDKQPLKISLLTQFICHRIPERTFNIRGYYFPVCSRCTGFYIGAFSVSYLYISFMYIIQHSLFFSQF